MVITIDGPAGSGKSSVALILAQRLGFCHLSSGIIYRAFTCYLLKHHLDQDGASIFFDELTEPQQVLLMESFLNSFKVIFLPNSSMSASIDGVELLSTDLESSLVAELTPKVSKFEIVRSFILRIQRSIGFNFNLVVDGRDVGTVVFPSAEYKFFLTASLEERTKRILIRLKEAGLEESFEKVLGQIKQRDFDDSFRKNGALKAAVGAIIIDSTDLSLNQTVDAMLNTILEKEEKK